jgi:SAM-dependent methyltransferase
VTELGSHQIAAHNAYQRRYYDRSIKPRMIPTGSAYIQRQIDELVAAAGLSRDEPIIEVGCGMGRYTIPLAERGYHVEGLDLSPVLLERLASYDRGRHDIPLYAADVIDPPSELTGRFSAAIGFFALHHMHDLEGCFRGMFEMLERGGRVAFVEPNALNPLYYIQIAVTPGMTWQGDRGVAKMRMGVVARAMEGAGLVNPRVTTFGFFPPFVANTRAGARLERTLENIPPLRKFLPFQIFTADRA